MTIKNIGAEMMRHHAAGGDGGGTSARFREDSRVFLESSNEDVLEETDG